MTDTQQLERKIWLRIWLANLAGVVPINIFFTLAAEYYPRRVELSAWYIVVPIAIYMPAYFWSRYRARQMFRPIAAWLDDGRAPTSDERALTLAHPRRLAIMSMWCWMWAIAWSWIVGLTVFVGLALLWFRVSLTILLSTLIACSLTYLVAEGAMRPVFAKVLGQDTPAPVAGGVTPRLTLTWVVGSATYLIAIALLVPSVPSESLGPYVVGACLFGLAVGATLTVIGARSVGRPLEGLRAALTRVEGGDLDVSVDVDDAGEVGQVQAAFNRMVAGLRERDRLKLVFGRHVGQEVAERAVASESLSGEELEATVLFVDVIGSTTLAAERRPEDVVTMLNALFAAVVRIVGEEGGLVNQFQGDGALCVFGAPYAVDDHAARGLRAATRLQSEIARLHDTYPGFDAAIGVSTGRVVGGDVGTQDRYEYTVIGDAANEASRLTDEAKTRETRLLASDATVTAAGQADGWTACGELTLRGRPAPTVVFERADQR